MRERIIALALTLVLCLGGAALAEEIYRVAIFEEPKSDNIIGVIGPDATAYTHAVLLPLYSSLYTVAPPRWDVVPSLAAGDPSPFVQEASGGAMYYTSVVPVRRDITWSDGTKLTAEDIAYSYNAILALDPNRLGGNWPSNVNPDVLARVEVLDQYTVKFWLKKLPGLAEWQYNLLQSVVFQKAHWEPVIEEALRSSDPVLTVMGYRDATPVTTNGWIVGAKELGAFWENRIDPNSIFPYEKTIFYESGGIAIENSESAFSYKAGDTSGDVALTTATGPLVDRAIYRVYLNQNAAIQALIAGEVDYILNPSGLQKGSQEQLARHGHIQVISNPANGFRFLGFNLRRTPMNNKAFRQAIATVINKEFVTETVLQGTAGALHSVVPPGNAFWHNPDVKVWGEGMNDAERLEEAVRILKAAGFSWDKEPVVINRDQGAIEPGEGLRMPDGTPVPQLELISPSPGYDPLRSTFAIWIEQWISNLGVPLRLRFTDFNLLVDRMNNRDFDLLISGWGLTIYPDHIYPFFHSSQAETGWNVVGYVNPEFDKVVDEFLSATTFEEARPLNFRAQEILAEDLPYVVLFDTPIVEAYNRQRVRYEFTEVLDGIQNLYAMPSQVRVIE